MDRCIISGVSESAAELYLFERETLRAVGMVCVLAGGQFVFDVDSELEYLLLTLPEDARLDITENGTKSLLLC